MDIFAVFAAGVAPLAMTVGFFVWDNHWKGSAYALNMFKCNLAGSLFCMISISIRSEGFRILWEQPDQVLIPLVVSSLLGIIIGDSAWLTALQMIGARKVIFVDSLKPFLAAIFGTLLNNEPFTVRKALALCCCTIGIMMVCFENETRNEGSESPKPESTIELAIKPNYSPLQTDALEDDEEAVALGIIEESSHREVSSEAEEDSAAYSACRLSQTFGYGCASINVLFDVYGSLLTKQNGVELNTWEVNLVRFGFAGLFMIGFSLCASLWHGMAEMETWDRHAAPAVDINATPAVAGVDPTVSSDVAIVSSDRAAPVEDDPWYSLPTTAKMVALDWFKVSTGVLFVTLICPALSNYALFKLDLGVALTLNSLGPLYSLPVSLVFSHLALKAGDTDSASGRDVLTWRGVLGTIVTFAGVVMLCM